MARLSETQSTILAAAVIMIAVVTGWTLMPKIMQMVSGGGPACRSGGRSFLHARLLRRAVAQGPASAAHP
jgi:hypothetical protein